MSIVRRRKLSTGATLRPPLPRCSSESNVLNKADVSNDSNILVNSLGRNNTQDFSSSPDISFDGIDGDETPETEVDYPFEAAPIDYSNEEDFSDDSESNISIKESSLEKKSHDYESVNQICTRNKYYIVCLLALGGIFTYFVTGSGVSHIDLQTVIQNFPSQNEELWLSFEAGVKDVLITHKPSTFILLYQGDAEKTLKNLTNQLSKYAVCTIRDCSKNPIVLNETELNSPEVVRNFGLLIEKYRDKLEVSGIMVINNLENINGTSAQVFHTFCDEVTPLVEKSLFIFTMKVDNLPNANKRMQYVEKYLKDKWTDVKTDTLNALITRITSMILEVQE